MHVQGLSLLLWCRSCQLYNSLSGPQDTHSPAGPQGRMPVVIHALCWPSRGDRCPLHTLCQGGPAVLL